MNELIVYAVPPSLYCAKLRIVLRHKGLTWDEQAPPGGYGSAEYKSVVPSGNLPALVHGDLTLADSEAIAEYLNDVYSDPPMLPAEPVQRARVRERSRFHDTRLEPALRQIFKHIPRASREPAEVVRIGAEVNDRLGQLGVLLEQTKPSTNSLTLGECGFVVSFEWLDALTPEMFQFEWPDSVRRWRERIVTHQAVADELADYCPKLNSYLQTTV